jgi:hypothetical protein
MSDSLTTYQCLDCGYSLKRFTNMEASKRLACVRCEGWMQPVETEEPKPYKKPNIIWVGIAHVIWFVLKPIQKWLDKYDRSEDDD